MRYANKGGWLCVGARGPSHQIRSGQIDLLFALLGELELLHVIVPPGEVQVPLLVQIGQVFLKGG